jgi:hypothetical protein
MTDALSFDPGSKARLTTHDLGRFPGQTLFDRLARTVCAAGCLPRKELYESWEVGRRARRLFRGGRVVDLGGGHGLLAHAMLLLDRTSPGALIVDPSLPASSGNVHQALVEVWPHLAGRVAFRRGGLTEVALETDDLVVSSHACGDLTDQILSLAIGARARVAVLPCCHALDGADDGDLRGWMDGPVAVDAVRAMRLKSAGYRIWTQTIPAAITPKNRLLLGAPIETADGDAGRRTGDQALLADEV